MIKLVDIAIERPIGSDNSNLVQQIIKEEIRGLNYELLSLPIECSSWKKGFSYLEQDEKRIEVFPSPFSKSFSGKGIVIPCERVSELENPLIKGNILLLHGEITKDPIMTKNFPFYFPEEHKDIYEAIEKAKPSCIITLTGKALLSGLDPFPFFEDGPQEIPSAYASKRLLEEIVINKEAIIEISSSVERRNAEQMVFKKDGLLKGKIIICAHVDTKYDTPGALDNAAGIYTLMKLAHLLSNETNLPEIEIVPFNGEEYYGVSGQLKYLEYLGDSDIRCVINIDSPGYVGSKNAISFYNFNEEEISKIMLDKDTISRGQEWYAGDHAMFAFKGCPCIVATSSNLLEEVVKITHTNKDDISKVDISLLNSLADSLKEIIIGLDKSKR